MTETTRTECTVREGRFVDPCDILSKATDIYQPSFNKAKGLFRVELYNRETRAPARSYHGVRTRESGKGGIAFNFCPFCGVRIDTPLRSEEDKAND